ncbi:MAG: TetR/AcrR family transcriptional regulator [Flavobacteriaceae bacterium]
MAITIKPKKTNTSTEEKIKEAAKTVFHKKGFAATRTRDIAEHAGINLALLNYYFRSKQKLFEIIMFEAISGFVQNMVVVVNNNNSSLDGKIEAIANNYIDFLSKEPGVPLFIVSEIRNNPDALYKRFTLAQVILDSVFLKQYREAVAQGRVAEPNPVHFLINLMGLIVFPFIAQPLLMKITNTKHKQFLALMQERKRQIPVWVKAMMYRD